MERGRDGPSLPQLCFIGFQPDRFIKYSNSIVLAHQRGGLCLLTNAMIKGFVLFFPWCFHFDHLPARNNYQPVVWGKDSVMLDLLASERSLKSLLTSVPLGLIFQPYFFWFRFGFSMGLKWLMYEVSALYFSPTILPIFILRAFVSIFLILC